VSEKILYAIPNVQTPSMPVTFDPTVCIGCNKCVEVCPIDVFIPNPKKGATPIIPARGRMLVLRLLPPLTAHFRSNEV
jgi:ferredoxin